MKYRNTSANEIVIPNVGIVEADGVIESEEALESSILQLVEEMAAEVAPAPAAAAPAPVPAPVAPVATPAPVAAATIPAPTTEVSQ